MADKNTSAIFDDQYMLGAIADTLPLKWGPKIRTRTYGSMTAPINDATLTTDFTDGKNGSACVVYHEGATIPTIPGVTMDFRFGLKYVLKTGGVNVIYLPYLADEVGLHWGDSNETNAPSPIDNPSLQYFLQGADINSALNAGLINGQTISQWDDISGNNRHATPNVVGGTYDAARKAILLTGTQNYGITPTGITTAPYTLTFIIEPTAGNAGADGFFGNQNATTGPFARWQAGNNWEIFSGAAAIAPQVPFVVGEKVAYTLAFGATNFSLWKNTDLTPIIDNVAYTADTMNDILWFGSITHNLLFLKGYLYETAGYNEDFADTGTNPDSLTDHFAHLSANHGL